MRNDITQVGVFAIVWVSGAGVAPGVAQTAAGPDGAITAASQPGLVAQEDSLAAVRADCDRALQGALSRVDYAALRARVSRLLAQSTDLGDRLGALKLASRLCWDGPLEDVDAFRAACMAELARVASASPRARVLLTEHFLPPLARVAPAQQPDLLTRFDALIDQLRANIDTTTRADLLFAKCKSRIEAHRGWETPWLDAAERQRLTGWLEELVGSPVAAPTGGDYAEQARSLQVELRETAFGVALAGLEGPDFEGGRVRLSDYRGRVVVLSFWSTWCLPCLELAPQEAELLQRLGDRGLTLIGVNSDPTAAQGKSTAEAKQMRWPHIWAPPNEEGSIVARLHIQQWPSIIVLDRSGALRAKFVGSIYQGRWTIRDVEREVLALLSK